MSGAAPSGSSPGGGAERPSDRSPSADPSGVAGVRGRDFRLLWASYGASNVADGILLSAGPLLVTTLTRDPLLVSLAVTVQILPTFLFSLFVGALVDRTERRRLQAVAHVGRAAVLVVLVLALLTDRLSLPMLYAVLFGVGTAEVVADTAGETLVAAVVPAGELGPANSRLIGTSTIANRLAGPPLGAFLFGLGLAIPWTVNVVLLLAAAVLVSRLSVDGRPPPVAADPARGGRDARRPDDEVVPHVAAGAVAASGGVGEDDPALHVGGVARLRREIAEGWRFTVRTPPVRRLVVLITMFNLTFGAVYGILVLWAQDRLGLDEVGFGTLLTASAVGGVIGSAAFPWLERRFSYTALLRTGLVVESTNHFLLASTTSPLLAGAVLVAFGVHEAVWGSLAGTIRLKLVPQELLGRVNGVYRLAVFAPLVVGSAIGGVLAEGFGILAPFWYAGVGASLTTIAVWRSMRDLGDAATIAADAPDPGP